MAQTDRIAALIEPTIEDMGYELVRVQLGQQPPTLQVMAERKDHSGMGVEDCATLSRALSAVLDVEDPISGAYNLEVSSPGLDRPLTRPQDFERFKGLEVKVEMNRPIDGQKRYRGELLGLSETQEILLRLEEGSERTDENNQVALPFAELNRAKLVLTDDLIKSAQKAADESQSATEETT